MVAQSELNIFLYYIIMGKIVLRKTLAVESFVKSLVERGVLEVKEIVDFQHQKLNPQLLQDLMMFIEEEITTSKYKKEQINRTELVKTILCQVFEFKDEEIDYLEKQITHLLDNGMLKKSILKKIGKGLYKLIKYVSRW
jgi:hypothetical protein